MRICLLLFLLSGALSGWGQNGTSHPHLRVEALPGDGVLRLLDRYQLRTPCNESYFYQINSLRKGAGLHEGRSYQLPVYVYTYNGRSIRSTTGINDRPWAEKVQLFNEIMHRSGLKAADYRDDKVLWVPYHQIYCPDQDIPLIEPGVAEVVPGGTNLPGTRVSQVTDDGVPLRGIYKIFGEEYARVPLEGTQLSGKVFYVVSGHGGPDPGAVGTYGAFSLCEDEYAYDVGLRLARNLLAYGATVYLITRDPDDGIRGGEILPCDKDETCWVEQEMPVNQSMRLTQRSEAVNALYRKNRSQGVSYQRLVVLHIDSNSKKTSVDMFFYHRIGDAESERFANRIKETVRLKYDEYRKGRGYTGTVSSRDLHMLRETEPVAVFAELGNIRNRNDQARFVIEGNRQLVANWLFEGLLYDALQEN
ncbi:MAG: N-acetylmuramoyl-L-alanine amidase [Bacteroidetes bacterium]|nr:MAG: N-acetylmuramoyl-L-alanine amidase [Bacteroidota bacterium]